MQKEMVESLMEVSGKLKENTTYSHSANLQMAEVIDKAVESLGIAEKPAKEKPVMAGSKKEQD